MRPLIVTEDLIGDGRGPMLYGVDMLDFLGSGDGTTDNATAFAAACTGAMRKNRPLALGPGVWRIATATTITLTADLRIELWGGAILLCDADVVFTPGASRRVEITGRGTIQEHGGSLVFQGITADTEAVTAEITRDARSLTVADESAFSAGDLVIIESDWFSEIHYVVDTAANTISLDTYTHNRIELGESPTVSLLTPISATVEGVTFAGTGATDGEHLRVEYGHHCTFRECRFTGVGAAEVNFYVIDSGDVVFTRCRFDEQTGNFKGLRFKRCGFVGVESSHWENDVGAVERRPLQFEWCHDVRMTNCTAHKIDGWSFAAQNCYGVAVIGNQIVWKPGDFSELAADANCTSRSGIFIIGCENVTIQGNQLRNCIGEGDIYLRSSNEAYTDSDKALPLRNIVIAGNTITDLLSTDVGGGHVGAIYAKSDLEDVTITGNAIESRVACIALYGYVGTAILTGNHLRSENECIAADEEPADTWGRGWLISGNVCERLVDADASLITLNVDPALDPVVTIRDNIIRALNQGAGTKYLINVYCKGGDSAAFADTIVRIKDNTLLADGSMRGVNLYGFTGDPNPAAVVVRDNLLDIGSTKYSALAAQAADEEMSDLETGVADPDVWGLNGKRWQAVNGAAQNVTSFAGLREGMRFSIRGVNGNTTFVNGANLVTKTGGNVLLAAGATIEFMASSATKVYEV